MTEPGTNEKIGSNLGMGARLENYWYYHKWHTIGGLVALFIVGVLVSSMLGTPKPDYRVLLNVNMPLPPQVSEALGETLERYADDRGGNGKINVEVVDVSINSGDENVNPQLEMAYTIKLHAEMQTDDVMLIICDREKLPTLRELGVFGQEKLDEAFNWNGTGMREERTEFLYLNEDLYFIMRQIPEGREQDEKFMDNWSASKELLDRLRDAYTN